MTRSTRFQNLGQVLIARGVKVRDNNTMPGLTKEERKFRDGNPVKVLKGEKKLIVNHKRTWDEIYEVLTAYKEQHGDCEFPIRYAEDS
jgi:hypothetical protein